MMIDNDNNDVFGDDDNDDDDDDNDKVRSLGSMVVRTLSKVSRLKGTDYHKWTWTAWDLKRICRGTYDLDLINKNIQSKHIEFCKADRNTYLVGQESKCHVDVSQRKYRMAKPTKPWMCSISDLWNWPTAIPYIFSLRETSLPEKRHMAWFWECWSSMSGLKSEWAGYFSAELLCLVRRPDELQKWRNSCRQLQPRSVLGSFGVALMSCKVNFHVVRSALCRIQRVYWLWCSPFIFLGVL